MLKCSIRKLKNALISVSAVGGHRVCPLFCPGQLLHPILHHGLRLHTYILRCQGSRSSRHPETATSARGSSAGIARRQTDKLHSEHAGDRHQETTGIGHGERRHNREPTGPDTDCYVRLCQWRQHVGGWPRWRHPDGGEGHAEGKLSNCLNNTLSLSAKIEAWYDEEIKKRNYCNNWRNIISAINSIFLEN